LIWNYRDDPTKISASQKRTAESCVLKKYDSPSSRGGTAALKALRSEDWADIALKMADRYDPFYQPGFEQKFNTLRRNILEMEAEAEAERAD
jgi:hypothetical protein